ncbi:MAG: pilus assembly protein [Microbacteriaceae bacterium]|nr:MAG: pilus assembly protein [Microbacteriaceae bacterium]
MRSRSAADDEGSAAAEFAVALPAVALVLAVCVGAIGVGSQQLRLQDAAADAARGYGRGESPGAISARAARAVPGASVSVSRPDGLVCVRLEAAARGPASVAGLALAASSCALDGGR